MKYNIVNLGDYDNATIINTSILAKQQSLPIKAAYYVNIDSNIASMLPQITKSKPINNDFLDFLIHIKENIPNLNLLPYVFEDSFNSTGMKNELSVYDCLLSFFAFDRISLKELYSLPCMPNIDDFLLADRTWSQMKNSRLYEHRNEKRARSIYCFLLKVYIINFSYTKNPTSKLSALIDFINTDLGVYFESGIILAYWYFNKSYECVNQFFQKIQPEAKNKLKKIEGMAMDLYHLWNMPTEMATLSKKYNIITLQAIATHDDVLAQIAKLNPIIRMAFYHKEAQVKYKYANTDILGDSPIVDSIIALKSQREHICKTVDLLQLSSNLEKQLLNLFDSI